MRHGKEREEDGGVGFMIAYRRRPGGMRVSKRDRSWQLTDAITHVVRSRRQRDEDGGEERRKARAAQERWRGGRHPGRMYQEGIEVRRAHC